MKHTILWMRTRRAWDRATLYLPALLMGALALGSWWLLRQSALAPGAQAPTVQEARHEPDYFMRQFALKNFDGSGRMKSEVRGTEGRHFPDTDTFEIDQVRIRAFGVDGRLTTATANRALSNADGTEVQLFGNAIVVREAGKDASGQLVPRSEFRSEFLHAFTDTERVRSHLPVEMLRGSDRFTADSMDYDSGDGLMNLRGRVRGQLAPRPRGGPG